MRGLLAAYVAMLCICGCAPLSGEAAWPPLLKKWYDRAEASFRAVDIEDADVAIENALRLEPNQPEVRTLAARIALAQLEYDRAVRLLEGIDSQEASSIRGRAFWYSDRIEQAADELDRLLADPEVRDPWAAEVAKLARRGAGRKPFHMTGSMLAVSEMPSAGAKALIVPVELNGEPALSLIATGVPEVMIDASKGREPTWVSLRFGQRLEVKDVPALSKDLSFISKQLNAPIKLLLGVNLLRHVRPTIDYRGSQFVVRTFDPPPPPQSTTVKLSYIRGGGMVFRGGFGNREEERASLLIDSSLWFPVALDDAGWKKAGIEPNTLETAANSGGVRHGLLPHLQFGAFDVPDVPGVHGSQLTDYEKGLDIDLDGMVGAGFLAAFRLTLVDGGRTLWIEDVPVGDLSPPSETQPAAPAPTPAAPAAPPAAGG